MNELKEQINIENMIYEIRGKQVMLDSDLAILYKTETKRINEAISRNSPKFPDRFCFKISEKEYNFLKSQIATSKGGARKGHTAFTEEGVAMLATVLKSDVATKVSIAIMDAFVSMRHYISNNLLEQKYINNQVIKNTEDIKLLQISFSKLEEKKIINEIYFNGQIYSAYSKLLDIMLEAKQELIIIDRYADKTVLDMISRLKTKVILIVKQNGLLKELDIKRYNEEFNNLELRYDDTFHDRYILIDSTKVYHCGASINHAGSRTFSINLLEDEIVKKSLLQKVQNLIMYNSKK